MYDSSVNLPSILADTATYCRIAIFILYELRRKITRLLRFANNEGADQPAHQRRLISAFVIRFLVDIIPKLATSEILIF